MVYNSSDLAMVSIITTLVSLIASFLKDWSKKVTENSGTLPPCISINVLDGGTILIWEPYVALGAKLYKRLLGMLYWLLSNEQVTTTLLTGVTWGV